MHATLIARVDDADCDVYASVIANRTHANVFAANAAALRQQSDLEPSAPRAHATRYVEYTVERWLKETHCCVGAGPHAKVGATQEGNFSTAVSTPGAKICFPF